jgi:hypothetical protein
VNFPELLHACEVLGVRLAVRLVVDAPGGMLTPEHKAALRAHRALLLVHLARSEQWAELSRWRWGAAIGDPARGSSSARGHDACLSASMPIECEA